MWKFSGTNRPPFAEKPGPGQESVWDYPRPPAILADPRQVEVFHEDRLIASSNEAFRVCETASPPTFYLPQSAIEWSLLESIEGTTYCEWKGTASYWSVKDGIPTEPVAWSYPRPRHSFARLKDYVSFYPGRVRCVVDGERVRAQPGKFYAGWITDEIVGPFKGDPGTGHW